jgi:hypothetical protein
MRDCSLLSSKAGDYTRSPPNLEALGLQGGREEITIFRHNVIPLMLDEIANDGVHILPQDFAIGEDAVDRLSYAAQAFYVPERDHRASRPW